MTKFAINTTTETGSRRTNKKSKRAQTIKMTTTWSDGTKTVEEEDL